MFHKPVIVLGAPRSGTSLMQKIVREQEGFRSVAKESGFIWREYCHPALQDWRYEGCPPARIDPRAVTDIRKRFQRYALSSSTWQKASGLDILRYQRSPLLAPVLRTGYFALAGLSRALRVLRPGQDDCARLVDKSVHSGLFLDLVDRVFPDARYIHIVRNGPDSIASMIDGWLNPDRFFTYSLPGGLQIPDYPHADWNFALPAGWEAYRDRPLADVVTFQWTRLQQAILAHFDDPERKQRLLRVKLEDLSADPGVALHRIGEFIEVPWSGHFQRLAREMPAVNARPADRKRQTSDQVQERMARMSSAEAEALTKINKVLGYAG